MRHAVLVLPTLNEAENLPRLVARIREVGVSVDVLVVDDGSPDGTGRLTIISSWLSGLTDKQLVDGAVNLVGRVIQEGSHVFRRLQTGLVQNYALLMLFGIFAFVSLYLFRR